MQFRKACNITLFTDQSEAYDNNDVRGPCFECVIQAEISEADLSFEKESRIRLNIYVPRYNVSVLVLTYIISECVYKSVVAHSLSWR